MALSQKTPWDALYKAGYRGLELPAFLTGMAVPPGGRILDVGCGRGEHLGALARRWGAEGVGVDLAWTALTDPQEDVARLCADAVRLPFRDRSFDGVYSLGVIEHLETARALAESFRVLKSGGWAYHSVPHRVSLWTFCVRPLKKILGRWRIGPERSFSIGEFEGLFKAAGFQDVSWWIAPFSSYDCYLAQAPLPWLYRLEDALASRLPRIGFFLHMRGRKA